MSGSETVDEEKEGVCVCDVVCVVDMSIQRCCGLLMRARRGDGCVYGTGRRWFSGLTEFDRLRKLLEDVSVKLGEGLRAEASVAMRAALAEANVEDIERYVREVEGENAGDSVELLAREIWTRQGVEEISMGSKFCNVAMRRLSTFKNIDGMVRLYDQMVERNVKPDVFTSSLLLLSLARTGRIDAMSKMLDELGAENVHNDVLTVVVRAYETHGRREDVLRVYKEVREKLRAQSIGGFSLLRAFGSHFDDHNLEDMIVEDVKRTRLNPDDANNIFFALQMLTNDESHWFTALLLRRIGQSGVAKFLESSVANQNSVSVAELLVNVAVDKGSVLEEEFVRAVLLTYRRWPRLKVDPAAVVAVWRHVSASLDRWDSEEIGVLLSALGRSGSVAEVDAMLTLVEETKLAGVDGELAMKALDCLYDGVEANAALFERFSALSDVVDFDLGAHVQMMRRYIATGSRKRAKKMRGLIRAKFAEELLVKDAETLFSADVAIAGLYEEHSKVLQLVDGMDKTTGGKLAVECVPTVIKALSRRCDPVESLRYLDEKNLLSQENAEGLMEAYLRMNSAVDVELVFRALLRWGLKESKMAHLLRLEAIVSPSADPATKRYTSDSLAEIVTAPKEIMVRAASLLLPKLHEMGETFYANELYTSLAGAKIKVDPEVHRSFVTDACRESNLESAIHHLRRYQCALASEGHISSETLEMEMQMCNDFKIFEYSNIVFRSWMHKSGMVVPTTKAYGYQLLAAAGLGDTLAFDLTLRHMKLHQVKKDMDFIHLLLDAHEIMGVELSTVDILKELDDSGLGQPDAICRSKLMRLTIRSGNYRQVVWQYWALKKKGIRLTDEHFGLTVSALIRENTIKRSVTPKLLRSAILILIDAPDPVQAYHHVLQACKWLGEVVGLEEFTDKLIREHHLSTEQEEIISQLIGQSRDGRTKEVFGSRRIDVTRPSFLLQGK